MSKQIYKSSETRSTVRGRLKLTFTRRYKERTNLKYSYLTREYMYKALMKVDEARMKMIACGEMLSLATLIGKGRDCMIVCTIRAS